MNMEWSVSTPRRGLDINLPPGLCLDTAVSAPKVLLADDHDLVRFGLRMLLDAAPATAIQWREAANLNDAMETYAAEPEIRLVLLDLNMADCKGLQGLRQFIQAHPAARIAVMSGTQDEFVVGQALALGAVSYLLKSNRAEATRAAILKLLIEPAASESAAGPRAGRARMPRFPSAASYDRIAELGPRHLEILELVLSGCSNQEISNAAALSLGTVKNYVSTILLALDVKSRSHLISLFH
jgi:DNA-binding NarL/FixJ family response regulator